MLAGLVLVRHQVPLRRGHRQGISRARGRGRRRRGRRTDTLWGEGRLAKAGRPLATGDPLPPRHNVTA